MNWYNITFTLGDPSLDGHGRYIEYHIQCNYSAKAETLVKLKVINSEDLESGKYEWREEGSFYINNTDDYANIFFEIVKLILPDLKWREADSHEEELYLLNGAGYGLFS